VEAVVKNGALQLKELVQFAEGTPVRVTVTPVPQ
jgi:predicted DNA-binding antitoxin AbrB/MazE fold protein